MPRSRGMIGVVETSYAAAAKGDPDAWIAATVEALAPVIGAGRGTCGYSYDARGELSEWTIGTPVVREGPEELALAITSTFAAAPASLLASLYRAEERATTASELQGFTMDKLDVGEARAFAKRLDVVDIVSLHAGDPAGEGAIFAAAAPKRRKLRARERWSLARVAGHLCAAGRLVRALGTLDPVAVLGADGRLLDASGAAKMRREPLRTAVRAMEKARGALLRRDPDESLSLWRALVDGRYSLVDRFEADGRRFIVAYENAPGLRDPRGLSKREAAIAGLLALALPDKTIAYELGLEPGTVRAHVHSIFRKIGASTRAEAIGLLAQPVSAGALPLTKPAGRVVVFEHGAASDVFASLSASERIVAELAASGATNGAIAKKTKKSAATIAKQLASAFAKLGIHSRAGLARLQASRRMA